MAVLRRRIWLKSVERLFARAQVFDDCFYLRIVRIACRKLLEEPQSIILPALRVVREPEEIFCIGVVGRQLYRLLERLYGAFRIPACVIQEPELEPDRRNSGRGLHRYLRVLYRRAQVVAGDVDLHDKEYRVGVVGFKLQGAGNRRLRALRIALRSLQPRNRKRQLISTSSTYAKKSSSRISVVSFVYGEMPWFENIGVLTSSSAAMR